MADPAPIPVVCVGAGWVTRERHIPALAADGRARIVGVVDSDFGRARRLADRAGARHAGTSLAESWLSEATGATIGTPPLSHADVVGELLSRGVHCLCEKPLAFPAARAAELARQAEQRGLVLAVVHNFQFSRSAGKLFNLLADGALGPIRTVSGIQLSNPRRRLPAWYRGLPGGLFLDESPHLLYLLQRLLGSLDLRTVDGKLEAGEIVNVEASFQHPSIWATLSMDFRAPVSEWQLVVAGDRALAALDVFRDILVVVPNDRSHRGREVLRTSATVLGRHLAGTAASGARLLAGRLRYGNDEVVRRFLSGVLGDTGELAGIAAAEGVAVVATAEEILRELLSAAGTTRKRA